MTTLLCVHGWGFGGGFWESLLARLPDFESERIDMGFYGEPYIPAVRRPLVVAHSMGLAWALAHIPRPWAGVLAVNAFPRFTRSQHFIEGVAPRMIERMQARFAHEPQAVTADFLSRCGVQAPDVSAIDPVPLDEALAWLGKCDERTSYLMLSCPRMALAGLADPIVPKEMSVASFPAEELILAEGGGHLLPLSHPDWVASQLRQLAARA
ncbi:alpha/beta hydrolase [Paramagnetospirillum kuznetsovii]|uniref:Alpha/beta hydrolase n=1 Tax=Paramagnetospirillum kuznetsovii TaxID=2053833 RepID=A0A364NWB5_9PROT|nr:alpha/beta hydrolase [Paramagnetospirillum kuznetsovii]RAU21368.1 alpha/beta hydrolase [Paramagnetospirillum kuznetsovii]